MANNYSLGGYETFGLFDTKPTAEQEFDQFETLKLGDTFDGMPDSKTGPSESKTSQSSLSNSQIKQGVTAFFDVLAGEMEADAISKQANFQADIMQLNGQLQMIQAGETLGYGQTVTNRYLTESGRVLSKQRAAFAQLGQEGGAAADVVSETKLIQGLNATNIFNQAYQQANNLKFKAQQTMLNAKATREIGNAQARQRRQAGYINAVGTFASGFASGGYGG